MYRIVSPLFLLTQPIISDTIIKKDSSFINIMLA